MMYIDVLDTILWKVWASTENQKIKSSMRQLFFYCSMRQQAFKRATVIDLRGRYDSARKELTAVQRWSSHCHLLNGLLWRNLTTWSSVSIVTWGVIKSEGYYHLRSANHRWDPASPGRFLSWFCGNVFFWKNGFLREQLTVVYLFNLFHLPPFETIPADGRQPVNAVHSLLASNTDLPVTIYNHPTSL